MKKILQQILVLWLSTSMAFGGTCPSSTSYLKESTNLLTTLTALAVTACKFIAAGGSDGNSGDTEAAAWQHAPGMTNCGSLCSSFTMTAGTGLIFKGGDTWNFGNTGAANYIGSHAWSQSTAGNGTNPIYIGFDPAWFTGGAWTRPVFNGDNALWVSPAALPASCPTFDFLSTQGMTLAAFNILDNIEITGVCSGYTGTAANPMFMQVGNSSIIQNVYYHGWDVTQLSTNLYGFATGISTNGGVIFTHDIVDGSDSPHWATGNANCTANGNWQCATGQGIYDHANVIEYSVFRYTANHGVTIDTTSIHDNLIEYEETAPTTAMTNAQHADAFMVFSGTLTNFCNNVTRHNYATQIMYANVNAGATLNICNNVWYDNTSYASGTAAPTNCINLAAQTAGSGQIINVYNNTFDNDTDDSTGGGCIISIYGTTGGNSTGNSWTPTINAGNNHLIGYANLAALFTSRSSGGNITGIVDAGGNSIQATTATARSQGYVQATTPVGDLSVNGSGSTISAGINETSLCGTMVALCAGSSGGPVSTSGSYSFPALTQTARPTGSTAWDSEASQFFIGNNGNDGGSGFTCGVGCSFH